MPAAAGLVRLLVGTLRIRRDESAVAALLERGAPMILAMWHSRLLVLPVVYGRRLPMRALVSRSLDGELTARFLGRLGIGTVRGSSGRGGAAGLRALARVLAEGVSVVVVPDGPRGPREVLKPGVIALARRTGIPIVPVAVGAAREWRLGSWDGFRIPKPFSRCLVKAGPPIDVATSCGSADEQRLGASLEACRVEVEGALRALSGQVDAEVGR
jgi:lysophospholipid acyltransferase (LPLAT)-like uncharacterized protein